MGDFYRYYEGKSVAPYLTIFCGGNHEASNYMWELYYGGWVAPNIYYLGAANLVRFGPLRISAMSGIWKGYDFRKPHFERLPYNADDLRSIHHVRELDVRKLLQVRTQVDIGLSHDWPRGIEHFGDSQELFRKKRGFKEDSQHGRLGNAAARDVLDRLRPAYWFSAHLHVKFAAAMPHDGADLVESDLPAEQPAVWGVEAWPRSDWDEPASHKAVTTDKASRMSKATSPVPAAESATPAGHTPGNKSPMPMRYDMVSNKIQQASGTAEDRLHAWNNLAAGGAREFERQQGLNNKNIFEENKRLFEEMMQRRLNAGTEEPAKPDAGHTIPARNADEIPLDSGSESSGSGNPSPKKTAKLDVPPSDGSPDTNITTSESLLERAATEGLRSKLPASFARPVASTKSTEKKPVPAAITNKLTRFLALDKPHNHDDFIHLMKINPINQTWGDDRANSSAPLRLQYDKEWLAITRVFANDLVLGDASAEVPPNKGEDYYLPRILEEETWVEEHLVKRGLMDIPYNFTQSAPTYDPTVSLATAQQPMEYANPQTNDFCWLLDIPNKFQLSETERQARMDAGPRPTGAGNGGHGHRANRTGGGHDRRGRGTSGRGGAPRGRAGGRGGSGRSGARGGRADRVVGHGGASLDAAQSSWD